MTDTAEVNFDAPQSKSKKRRTARRRPAPAAPRAAPFPGLTRSACADTCGPNCAISGSYCAHPCKGGLQPRDMNTPALLKKLASARDQLSVRVDPDRFK